MQAKVGLQFDFCDPLQRLAQNASFEFQLSLVGDVLVMASAALAEVRTTSFDAVGRRFDQLRDRPAREARLLLPDLGLDSFARQHKRHKDRHAAPVRSGWRAGEAVAAVDQFFYGKQQVVSVARVLCILTREFAGLA